MGERGPAKKPAALHKRNRTYRPSRHGDAELPVAVPDPPPDLHPVASAQWQVLGRKLAEAGLIADLDQMALRLLCESIELYLEACDEVRRGGLVLFTDKGNAVQNPALAVRNRMWAQIVSLAKQFGMTPSARTGLKLDARQPAGADLGAILGFAVN